FGHRLAGGRIEHLDPGRLRHVEEMPVSFIVIETAGRALERHRRAVRAAKPREHKALAQIGLAGPTHVVANKQVEFAIVVVIEEPATGAPLIAASTQTGLSGDVAKLATAEV